MYGQLFLLGAHMGAIKNDRVPGILWRKREYIYVILNQKSIIQTEYQAMKPAQKVRLLQQKLWPAKQRV
jgi:hypothetical protein